MMARPARLGFRYDNRPISPFGTTGSVRILSRDAPASTEPPERARAPYTTQGPEHSSLGRLRRSEQRDLPAIQDAVTPAVGAVVSIVAALA